MRTLAACGMLLLIIFSSCSSRQKIDLLIINGTVYTVDTAFSTTEAVAIRDGKIVATGSTADLQQQYEAREIVDVKGQFVYPGFIDAHAHFVGYGIGLQTADLTGTNSWEEILTRLREFATTQPNGWLIGRGWDQNDWAVKEFPDNKQLNTLFPDRPVLLTRVDGHAAIANQKALDMAGVKPGFKLTGGEGEVSNGQLTGILVDNAVDLVSTHIPAMDASSYREALLDAQRNCFAMGLTTIADSAIKTWKLLTDCRKTVH